MKDRRVIILLLFALLGQILLLLWHMDLLTFSNQKLNSQKGIWAGEITKIENNLKRRPLESLIWEESVTSEKIFYFDSILTLKESTAQIKLENGTQISLSENTLITIEPPDEESPGEIRIQFSQGSLKTRNPYQTTKIQNEKKYLNIKAESDVEIYKNNEDSLEIFVKKGEVSFENEKGKMNIAENQVYREENGESQTLKIDKSLSWQDIPMSRIYTHHKKMKVELKWNGNAKVIRLFSQGNENKEIKIDQDRFMELELPLGQHRLQLESDQVISEMLSIQIWQAPLIHLLSPQPRNRHQLKTSEFIWTSNEKVKKYHLKLKGKNQYQDQLSEKNSVTQVFSKEDDVKWGVWGEDQEGFIIPPLYEYDLYLRENPFAPPRLNSPQLIKPQKSSPKQSSHWYQLLFFSQAYAQDEIQALFSWEKVEGADLYWLEVSESIDFRKLILQLKLNDPEYAWKNFDDSKKYYWRVAAGNSDGRMGIFSEPTEVVLVTLKESRKNENSTSLTNDLNKKSASQLYNNNKNKVISKSEKLIGTSNENREAKVEVDLKSKEPKVKTKRKKLENGNRIWLRPGYSLKNFKEDLVTVADFRGLSPIGIGFSKAMNWREESVFNFDLKYTTASYKPVSKTDYPFQEEISLSQAVINFNWQKENSNWGFGGTLQYLPMIKRQSFENILPDQKTALGPQVQWKTKAYPFHYIAQGNLLMTNDFYGISANQQIYFFPFSSKLYLGIEIEGVSLLGNNKKMQMLDVFFNMGLQF